MDTCPTIRWNEQNSIEVLKANYYDMYDYKKHLSVFNTSLDYVPDKNYGKQYIDATDVHCKDLLTGSMTRVLENSSEVYVCYYYDYDRNLIQPVVQL